MTRIESKKATIDTKRLTQEYLFPDVYCGDLKEMKIPTVEELSYIGYNNVFPVKHHLRDEEDKLNRILNEIADEIEKLSIPHEANNCDWHGFGYLHDHDESKDMSYDDRLHAVGSCQYGRDVADWCSMTRMPHCEYRCLDSGTTCPHTDKCFSVQPYANQRCKLTDPNGEVLRKNCTEFLRKKQEDIKVRKVFIAKYIHNVSVVLKRHRDDERPEFYQQDRFPYVRPLNPVVEIYRDDKGRPQLEAPIFVAALAGPDGREKRMILNVRHGDETRAITVRTTPDSDKMFLSVDDFLYLVTHDAYRQVWLGMLKKECCPFTAAELTEFFKTFEGFRSIKYYSKKDIIADLEQFIKDRDASRRKSE